MKYRLLLVPRLFGQWQGWLLGGLSASLVVPPLRFYLYNHPQADELGFRDFDRPLVALIPGMLGQPAPNFYRIVGAQVVAFAFPILAIVQSGRYLRRRWDRPPWRRRISLVLVGGLVLVLGVHLAGTQQAYFVAWPKVEGVSVFWQSGLAQASRYPDSSPEASPVALCTILTYEHDPWWRPAK